MRTIRFDEEDHHHSAPYFNLANTQGGGRVSLRDFHERSNLVLVFVPAACQDCSQFLQQLAAHSPELAGENARLVAVLPPGLRTGQDLAHSINSLILLLEDPGQEVRRAYTALMAPGLVTDGDLLCFVLDQYGAPYACLAGSRLESTDVEDILAWLRFIGIQCPE